jgi:hypothetical protein
MRTMAPSTYFELTFRPNLRLISVVRRFVSDFYADVLQDGELAAQLALATHELLDNGVRYATTEETGLSVEVAHGDDPRIVRLQTRNRASDEDVAVVKRLVEAMQSASDPFAYYQDALKVSAARTTGSGLGLPRIFAEADMSVDYEVRGDELLIHAKTEIRSTT